MIIFVYLVHQPWCHNILQDWGWTPADHHDSRWTYTGHPSSMDPFYSLLTQQNVYSSTTAQNRVQLLIVSISVGCSYTHSGIVSGAELQEYVGQANVNKKRTKYKCYNVPLYLMMCLSDGRSVTDA